MTVKRTVALVFTAVFTVLVCLSFFMGLHSVPDMTDGFEPVTMLPEINQGFTYTQQLNPEKDGLKAVYFLFGRYNHNSRPMVFVTMRDDQGHTIQEWQINADVIRDNYYHAIELSSPIMDSAGKTYYIDFTSDALYGDGVTIFCNPDGTGCTSMGVDFGDTMCYRMSFESPAATPSKILYFTVSLAIVLGVGISAFIFHKSEWTVRMYKAMAPAFLFAYMFLIHSPIEFFLMNAGEFEFILSDFVLEFVVTAIVISVGAAGVIALLPGKVFDAVFGLVMGIDLAMYVQLNFLNRNLGLMDGSEMGFSSADIAVNAVIWAVLIILPIVIVFIVRNNKGQTAVIFACLALLVMQLTSLTAAMVQSPKSAFSRFDYEQYYLSANDQFTVSANNNVIIIILDAYSNAYLEECLETYPEVADILKDFTYYNNADCHYEGSVYSINYLISGTEFDPSVSLNEWFSYAWDNERNNNFYDRLAEQGYRFNLYSNEFDYLNNEAKNDALGKISNLEVMDCEFVVHDDVVRNMLIRSSEFRFCPLFLKDDFYFTGEDYTGALDVLSRDNSLGVNTHFILGDAEFYDMLLSSGLQTDDSSNYFIMQHLFGVHTPLSVDADCRNAAAPTLVETERGCWVLVEEYLNQLKALGVYDNSTIIITADHGVTWGYENAQPIFFIKPFGQVQDAFNVTNAPISATDMMPTVIYLAGGEYSDLGTTIFEHTDDELRERTYYARAFDEDLPRVPKLNSPGTSEINCFYAYTYTGDLSDLHATGANGPTAILHWTDTFY